MASERATQQRLFVVCALLFAASTAVTVLWCASMSAMAEMPMPGGWTMTMVWMRMPGQTWQGAAASFLGMWIVMMVAMMLPSLIPMLWHYRQTVARTTAWAPTPPFRRRRGLATGPGAEADRTTTEASRRRGEARFDRLTALVAVGYFFVWSVFGMVVYPLGVALAAVEMRQPALARAVPIAGGVVVLLAGALQFTVWKLRQLACCREARAHDGRLAADAGTAWRHGLRLGLHCGQCCGGLMVILLVSGIMDLRAMAAVTAAITVERFAPDGERIARVVGAVVVGTALFLIARATGLR